MNPVTLAQGDALLIVDVQKDFLSGGRLGVAGGDLLIPVINEYIGRFRRADLPIYASRDWHPPRHCSFQEQGGPWPIHCVAGSHGAEFADNLGLSPETRIISKATGIQRDAYSAFDQTALASRLRADGIQRLFICGLATEYCVLGSTLGGIKLGFTTVVLGDAIAAIESHPGDCARALAAMKEAGAVIIACEEIRT
ncbi:MAG: isochorismatase family protein [Methylococcales bacterium]